MSNDEPIKVIQWATGTVGIHAVPGIVAHPDLELVGLYWHFVEIIWIVIFTVVYLLSVPPT